MAASTQTDGWLSHQRTGELIEYPHETHNSRVKGSDFVLLHFDFLWSSFACFLALFFQVLDLGIEK